MQHSGYRSILKAAFPIALFAGMLFNAPLKAAEYTQQMQLSANGEILSLLLRPSLVTANLSVVDNYGSACLLYTSPSPRDATLSRMPSSA